MEGLFEPGTLFPVVRQTDQTLLQRVQALTERSSHLLMRVRLAHMQTVLVLVLAERQGCRSGLAGQAWLD